MQWDWDIIIKSLPSLLGGLVVTVELVVISAILGFVLGLILALLRVHRSLWVKTLPFLYIFFFRGTPLLVQLFLIYYGLSQFEFMKNSFLWEPVFKKAYWCAVIAFTLNTSAYVAEIIRGAIESIPDGELEAADAIGMSSMQKLTRIVIPRAFGIMLPAYSNEVIFMLKGSSLAMTVALIPMELTGVAKTISARNYAVFELYFAAGVLYLILSWIILFGFRLLERHFNKHHSYVPPDVQANTIPKI